MRPLDFASYVRGPRAVSFKHDDTVHSCLVLWLRSSRLIDLDAIQSLDDLKLVGRILPRAGPMIDGIPALWKRYEAIRDA
jgi:hypothetical protein